MPHPMDSHPCFLKQIVGLLPARELAPEEPQQGWAQGPDKSNGRLWIGLLVPLHPAIYVVDRSRGYQGFLQSNAHR
jgi:hypothetical protein